jgi:hypothetical protein
VHVECGCSSNPGGVTPLPLTQDASSLASGFKLRSHWHEMQRGQDKVALVEWSRDGGRGNIRKTVAAGGTVGSGGWA